MGQLWRAVRSDLPAAELAPFRTSGRLGVGAAIQVYKNAYWIRQHECLCELFPRLVAHMGSTKFRDLARRYLLAHPSSHPELEHLGADLPAFLRTTADRNLAGLAALELALVESALSPDSSVANLTAIRPSTFGHSRLRLVPSLRVVVLDDDALHVLHAEAREVVGAHAAVTLRVGFATKMHLIGLDEHAALELVRSGARIDELLDRHAHDVSGLHQFLQHWFARSWIAEIDEEA